jgi:hypothetical protein
MSEHTAEKDAPVHACPPKGSGIMPCCGRTPFEVPSTDQMTLEPASVTCVTPPAVTADHEPDDPDQYGEGVSKDE